MPQPTAALWSALRILAVAAAVDSVADTTNGEIGAREGYATHQKQSKTKQSSPQSSEGVGSVVAAESVQDLTPGDMLGLEAMNHKIVPGSRMYSPRAYSPEQHG